jgi:DNA sulfur modification protein DndD
MKLLSIELSNFRAFYGHHRLELAAEEDRRVTIFHGENGAGKTNLLNAIHWCVTGTFTPRFQDKRMLVNKEAYREGVRDCFVELVFENEMTDGRETYRVRRSGTNDTGTGFEVFRIEKGNSIPVPRGDSLLRRLLPPSLTSWFFFDAEAIGSLELSGSDEFRSDLRKTLGFDLVDKLLADLEKVQSRRNRDVAIQTKDKDLQAIQAEIENTELVLPDHLENHRKLERRRLELETEITRVRSDLKNQPQAKPLEQRRRHAEAQIKRLQAQRASLVEESAKVLGTSAAPVILLNLANRLEGHLNEQEVRGKLPSPFSDQLIKDILHDQKCICGRPVSEGSHEEHNIRNLVEHASTTVLNQRINRVRFQRLEIERQATNFPLAIQQIRTQIASVDTELGRQEEERNEVTRELQGINLEAIQRLEEERASLESQRDGLLLELGKLSQTIETVQARQKDLRSRYDIAAKKVQVSARLKRELQKTEKLIAHIKKTSAAQESQALLILAHELNAVLGRYLTKHYQAKIDPKTYAVQLLDQEGRKVGHSTGEGQVLKFAFIATVVAMAAKKTQQKVQWLSDPTIAPLVLDAPFSALDPEYQGSVARNLASQATQLVLMISSAHWSKSVAESLAPQVGKRYLIVSKEAGPQGNKPLKTLTLDGVRHELNAYGAERSESVFVEIK